MQVPVSANSRARFLLCAATHAAIRLHQAGPWDPGRRCVSQPLPRRRRANEYHVRTRRSSLVFAGEICPGFAPVRGTGRAAASHYYYPMLRSNPISVIFCQALGSLSSPKCDGRYWGHPALTPRRNHATLFSTTPDAALQAMERGPEEILPGQCTGRQRLKIKLARA